MLLSSIVSPQRIVCFFWLPLSHGEEERLTFIPDPHQRPLILSEEVMALVASVLPAVGPRTRMST
jgi:hypothetical protein